MFARDLGTPAYFCRAVDQLLECDGALNPHSRRCHSDQPEHLVIGATGLISGAVTARLLASACRVVGIERRAVSAARGLPTAQWVTLDGYRPIVRACLAAAMASQTISARNAAGLVYAAAIASPAPSIIASAAARRASVRLSQPVPKVEKSANDL